jgi:hypothetical protein
LRAIVNPRAEKEHITLASQPWRNGGNGGNGAQLKKPLLRQSRNKSVAERSHLPAFATVAHGRLPRLCASSLWQAGLHQMLAEQPAFGGVLERMALDEPRHAEPGMDAQEVEADFARLVDPAAGRNLEMKLCRLLVPAVAAAQSSTPRVCSRRWERPRLCRRIEAT